MAKRSFEDEDIDLENEGNKTSTRTFAVSKRANRFITLKVPYSGGRYYHRNNELSRGAHSIVYKLFNEDETEMFAGKRLLTKDNKALKLKIIDELEMYKLICKKKHPNIIQLNESFQSPNHNLYMVLEYANNGTLQNILQYRGSLSELESKSLLLQMCGGIYWLHRNHIIHGDLKLGNILIHNVTSKANGKYDIVKICDFGHSFINDGSKNYIDHESDIIGTPYYLAPEVIYRYRGINTSGKTIPFISFPIDIWSIGVVLFTMLFGCNPFITNKDELHSLSMTDLMSRITSNTIKLPYGFVNQLSPLGNNLLVKILRQNPLKRITLLGIISHDWFTSGFIKDIELLNSTSAARLANNNNTPSMNDYINALKEYGFGSLLNKPKKSDNPADILHNLKLNTKKAKKKLSSPYHHKFVHIAPITKTNIISKDASKRIIADELQTTLRTLYGIELQKKETSYVTKAPVTTPGLITKRQIIERKTKNNMNEELFLYQLANGQLGCLFNGNHSILLNDSKYSFWYIIPDDKSGWISKCFSQDIERDKFPTALAERLQNVCDYKLNMELNNNTTEKDEIWCSNGANLSYIKSGNDTFLRKYAIFGEKNGNCSSMELYFLSDGTYQFNFKTDQIIVLLQNFGQQITILDKNGEIFTDNYYSLLWNSNQNHFGDLKGILFDKLPIIKETLMGQLTNVYA